MFGHLFVYVYWQFKLKCVRYVLDFFFFSLEKKFFVLFTQLYFSVVVSQFVLDYICRLSFFEFRPVLPLPFLVQTNKHKITKKNKYIYI